MLRDEPAGRTGDQVGRVTLFIAGCFVNVPVALALARQIKIIDRTIVMTVKMSETLIVRVPLGVVMAKVPLAENAALLIANLGQGLWQR